MPKDSRAFYSEMGVQWLSDRKDPLHTDEELTYLLDVQKAWHILSQKENNPSEDRPV